MLRRVLALSSLCLLALLPLTACGDDELGGAFVPDPPDEIDPELGPPSPISVGLGLWYQFDRTYRASNTNDGTTGLIDGEKQASGNICLKVTEVKDTATEQYKDAAQTEIVTSVKITGTSTLAEIPVVDQVAASGGGTADPATVDAAHDNLWIKRFTVPSRGHGFGSPNALNPASPTRSAPVPPNAGLSYLPFFEVRTSVDKVWGGWDGYYDEAPSHGNFLSSAYNYFINSFSTDFWAYQMYKDQKGYKASCRDITSSGSCNTSEACVWDFQANAGAGACTSYYVLTMVWRETATTGMLTGPILHRIRLEYTADGVLHSASETLVPDQNPTTTTKPMQFEQCTGPTGTDPDGHLWTANSGGCATANIQLVTDQPFSGAYCTF